MAFSTVPTVVVGQLHTAAMWNTYIRDNGNWFGTRKAFKVRRVAAQSIPNTGTATAFTFDTEDSDTDAFGAVPSTTYAVPSGLDGVMGITAQFVFASTALGTGSGIRVTTAGGINFDGAVAPGTGVGTVSAIVPLAATNTIGASAFQTGAAAVNATCTVWATWLFR